MSDLQKYICASMMLLALAGCSSNYVMTTKSGQSILTEGKPQLDEDTGMLRYTDPNGNEHEINSSDITQLIKAK